MPFYEHVFMARQDISQAQVDALTKEFSDVITNGGGKITKSEYWGLKGLGYKIKKNRKAHYMLFNIDGPPAAVVRRQLAWLESKAKDSQLRREVKRRHKAR